MSVAIEWTVVEDAFSYTVQRSDDNGATYFDLATNEPGVVYIDTTNTPADFTKLYQVLGIDCQGNQLVASTEPLTIYEVDETALTRLYGRLVDPTGRPIEGAEIRIYQRPGDEAFYDTVYLHDADGHDAPQFSDANDAIEATVDTFVQTNAQGNFQVYLIRNTLFVVQEPRTKLKLWFMTPNSSEIGLHEIENNVGYKTRIHNPF